MKLIIGGLALAAMAGVLWARSRYVVVTVQGTSMVPTLSDGDRVLVRRLRIDRVSAGDVVVLEPPLTSAELGPRDPDGPRWNIKRAVALPGDPVPPGIGAGAARVPAGALVVLGDNADSVDSRQRGFFDADRLLGVALRRLGGSPL
ncbi:hypothetical protein Ppa06_67680 [Planomonospora parontospora subsp. parontospora]|uniref:Peptidase S26 domain-containing protein n=2 Tax=Planomonospora parontospora TaxID=58119 RepID=A0AA37BP30_9ACTN|nr:S26 family signal peptidase [Planomonospora parontospora]GGK99313.1 hypothetical protein GCM10010126_68530 [Planomonospora parontospora]GII12970.1 hypothetical protein Ppa06_67680 [Planomonospora parontospora subsp. parontospora]